MEQDANNSPREGWETTITKTSPSHSSSLEEKVREIDQLLTKNSWLEDHPSSDDEDSFSADMDPDGFSQLQKELREAEESLRFKSNSTKVPFLVDSDNRDDSSSANRISHDDKVFRSMEDARENQEHATKFNSFVESRKAQSPEDDCFVYEMRESSTIGREDDSSARFSEHSLEFGSGLEQPSSIFQSTPLSPSTYDNDPIQNRRVQQEDNLSYSSCSEPEGASILPENDSAFSSSAHPSDEGDGMIPSDGRTTPLSSAEDNWEVRSWQTFGSSSKYFRPQISKVAFSEDGIKTSAECMSSSHHVSANPAASVENECQVEVKEEEYTEKSRSFDDDVPEKKVWTRQMKKWTKSKWLLGLLFCVLQIAIHSVVLKTFISFLISHHSMDFIETPAPPMCEPSIGCTHASPFAVDDETGYGTVVDSTERRNHYGKMEDKLLKESSGVACSFNPQSPTAWYSVTGHGGIFTASVYSASDEFSVVMTVLKGGCEAMEGIHGPTKGSDSFKTPESLSWDTTEGKTYSIAIYGEHPETTGYFQLEMWDSRRTKMILEEEHRTERGDGDELPAWVVGCFVGTPLLFLLLTVISS